MSIEKKLITRAIKQATMSIIFAAHAHVAHRFQSMQTIIFDYQDTRYKNLYYEFSAHIKAHIGMA